MDAGEYVKKFIKPEYQKEVRVYSCRRGAIERRMWPLKRSDKISDDYEVFIKVKE